MGIVLGINRLRNAWGVDTRIGGLVHFRIDEGKDLVLSENSKTVWFSAVVSPLFIWGECMVGVGFVRRLRTSLGTRRTRGGRVKTS